MKKLNVSFTLLTMLICGSVFAKGPPSGAGNSHGNFGPASGSMPPGLHDKGTPPGLDMQNKTPQGWSEGQKTGWSKTHHQPTNKKSKSVMPEDIAE